MNKHHGWLLCFVAGCWTSAPPATPTPKPEPVQPVERVQPVRIEQVEAREDDEGDDDDDGVVGGVYGGVIGGVVGGPPPPPPPPTAPQNVSPQMLESIRIAGDKLILPNAATKVAIGQAGKDRVIGTFKMCLADDGAVATVSLLKSTGFPTYDRQLADEIRTHWRYQPFYVNGRAVPVCTALTFIYTP